ncbi:MAG: helix-turn-helix transcriptional regulator [Pseudomonadota bacterium]
MEQIKGSVTLTGETSVEDLKAQIKEIQQEEAILRKAQSPDEIVFEFNEARKYIRTIRQMLKMEQKEVANKCGFSSAATVSHYETGARNLTLIKLTKIFDALGYNVRIIAQKKRI